MAARHLAVGQSVGYPNSKEIATHASAINALLWNDVKALDLFKHAISVVDQAVKGNWKRDHMRNQPATQDVLTALASASASH